MKEQEFSVIHAMRSDDERPLAGVVSDWWGVRTPKPAASYEAQQVCRLITPIP